MASSREGIKRLLETAATIAVTVAALTVTWVLLRPKQAMNGVPPPPREAQSFASTRSIGSLSAPVGIIEYADFECPYSAAFAVRTLPVIEKKYIDTGKVRFGFRHLPLPTHTLGWFYSQVTECAAQSDKFWNMHDTIFQSAKRLTQDEVRERAKGLGLGKEFEICLAGESVSGVTADLDSAAAIGALATPLFLLGPLLPDGTLKVSEVHVGSVSAAKLSAAIEAIIDKK